MRTRKVINLYSSEPAHAELLEYLDSIDGDNRRQSIMAQMLIIGFRVMQKHESGDEALFRVRNPDMSKFLSGQKRELIRGGIPNESREGPKKGNTYDATPEQPMRRDTAQPKPVTRPAEPIAPPAQPLPGQHTPVAERISDSAIVEEQEEDVLDPLARLKMMSDEES